MFNRGIYDVKTIKAFGSVHHLARCNSKILTCWHSPSSRIDVPCVYIGYHHRSSLVVPAK